MILNEKVFCKEHDFQLNFFDLSDFELIFFRLVRSRINFLQRVTF